MLVRPTPFVRVLTAVLAVGLAVNLFFHGAQPYAVGLFTPPWDKLAHMTLFGGFAALLWVALGARWAGAVFVLCLAIGAADELVQMQLPGRSPGWDDLLFDAIGAGASLGMLRALRRRIIQLG